MPIGVNSIKTALLSHRWTLKGGYDFARRNKNIVFFLAGFLFDAFTITRIDALSDITIQILYLAGLSWLLIYQYRFNKNMWTPPAWFSKVWSYNVELLHFFYGGLLSAYVILYLKSTSGARAVFFLILLGALLIINEMPQVKKLGYRLRLSLYAFCVTSFMIYFVAIVLGRMGTWVFLLSVGLSAVLVWLVARALVAKEEDRKIKRIRLYLPAAGLFMIIVLLYYFRLIPPVPLSIQYQGIFHHILKHNKDFRLRYPKPPFYAFWRDNSQPFLARPEDSIYYFARIFAPRRFNTRVYVRWELWDNKEEAFITTDVVPLDIVGGRAKGFRGFVSKKNYQPGRWRVSTETEDQRVIGTLTFNVKEDDPMKNRQWVDHIM